MNRWLLLIVGGAVAAAGHFARTSSRSVTRAEERLGLFEERSAMLGVAVARVRKLEAEVAGSDARQAAVRALNGRRVVWSRKLDQLFDVIASREAPYLAYLTELTAESGDTQQGDGTGGTHGRRLEIVGALVLESQNEAPAQASLFHRAVTRDPERTRTDPEFFRDFATITDPILDLHASRPGAPADRAAFRYELRLKPVPLEPAGARGGR